MIGINNMIKKYKKAISITKNIENMKKLLKNNESFFIEIKQHGYDREIDEGFGTSAKRYVTFDVTERDLEEISDIVFDLNKVFLDFNVVKYIRLVVFRKENKHYIAINGLSHMFYEHACRDAALDQIQKIMEKYNLIDTKYVSYNEIKLKNIEVI